MPTNLQRKNSGLRKNPDEWATRDEPLTRAQRSYLETLSKELKLQLNIDIMTKAEAAKKIDELQQISGRQMSARA